MKRIAPLILLIAPLAAAYAQGKPLTADEVRKLVSDKTMRFPTDARGSDLTYKLNADGTGVGSRTLPPNFRNTASFQIKWRVSESGELCTHPQATGFDEVCTAIAKGEGEAYVRLRAGQPVAKFTLY